MLIFGVDTHAAGAAVCITDTQSGRIFDESYNDGRRHSSSLAVAAQRAFELAGVKPVDIDLYSIGAGPGSYTGIRMGAAFVMGLAVSGDIPCAVPSSLLCLALSAEDAAEGSVIISVSDARNSNCYWAAFRRENGFVSRLHEDTSDIYKGLCDQIEESFCSEKEIIIIGSGACSCYNMLAERGFLPRIIKIESDTPSGGSICAAGKYLFDIGGSVHPADIRANYLKPVAAKTLAERMKEGSLK